jgi:REP element-mobilizing transposase RayT
MREVCARLGAELREFNGQDDHVHLLVPYPPGLALFVLVNRLTGVSSRRLRRQYPSQDGNAYGAGISGARHTSPPPAAAPL